MLVSIIITNYNYSKYLHRSIRSCLKQTINDDDLEVILVDDNSSDKSLGIAKDYEKLPNFKVISTKKNMGVAYCSNLGLKNSKGKFVVRVDSDDYVTKEFANFLSYYLIENPSILGVACDYYHVDDNEKKINHLSAKTNPVSCGIMYNKKKLINLGGYNSKYLHREEEELRVRLGNKYKIHYLNIPLYRYRMHKSNKTKSNNYKELYREKIEKQKSILKKKLITGQKISKNIVAIIPARAGSKRLKNKNIYPINGRPMIYWSIKASKLSSLVNKTYVSSESEKILNLSKKFGAIPIRRSKKLSKDNIYKIDVIKNAVEIIEKRTKKKPTIIVSLQANSPNVTTEDIDNTIVKLIKNKKKEIISVDKNLNQNAAIRTIKYDALFENTLSTHFGCLITNSIDIHTKKDIKNFRKNGNK